jgi:hypothetical protein
MCVYIHTCVTYIHAYIHTYMHTRMCTHSAGAAYQSSGEHDARVRRLQAACLHAVALTRQAPWAQSRHAGGPREEEDHADKVRLCLCLCACCVTKLDIAFYVHVFMRM